MIDLEERIRQLENKDNSREVEVLLDDLRNYSLISNEYYTELVEHADFLNCLEAAGVDNWDGYSIAQEMFYNEDDEDFDG